MTKYRITIVLGVVSLVALTACGSSGSKSPAAERASTSSSTPASTTSGEGTEPTGASGDTGAHGARSTAWPTPGGCNRPSAGQIGAAFGTPMTKSIPASDDGCLWEASPGHGVQVSYHPNDDPEIKPATVATLHNLPGNKDIPIPGASSAFLRAPMTIGGNENITAFVTYPQGTVQVAFSDAPGALTQDRMIAVIMTLVG